MMSNRESAIIGCVLGVVMLAILTAEVYMSGIA